VGAVRPRRNPTSGAPGTFRARTAGGLAAVLAALLASALLLFLVLPVAGLAVQGGAGGLRGLAMDRELRGALLLTGAAASAATLLAVVCGTPLAWALARRRLRGAPVVAALLDLPLVLPHPVAGLALLLVLGRDTPLGAALLAAGVRVVSAPLGIVLAMLFVSAPLYVAGAAEAFARVDARYEGVARTLGDSWWRAAHRVTLPLAGRGLLAAAIVTWARAVSEFGAIVIIAYHPRVASVLVYDRFTSFGMREAVPAAAALLIVALVPLVLLRLLRARPGVGEQP
jgi:molybdate/tungstate transport system permease protein